MKMLMGVSVARAIVRTVEIGYSHERFMGITILELWFFIDIVADKLKLKELQSNQAARYIRNS